MFALTFTGEQLDEPIKPYDLASEEREHYLYAHIKADTIDEAKAMSYLREVAAKCRKLKYKRLLIERDIPVMLSSGSLYFVFKGYRELMDGIKVAFVNPHHNIDEGMNFAVLMATNCGADFTHHPDIASAEKWLLGK